MIKNDFPFQVGTFIFAAHLAVTPGGKQLVSFASGQVDFQGGAIAQLVRALDS